MFQLFTTLFFFFLLLLSSAFPIFHTQGSSSRTLLRAINSGAHHHHHHQPPPAAASSSVVDLKATDFEAVLKETPATHAIVEFFAHWCPACRNYKPQYEKVARLFNGAHAVHPGIILVAQVDCANKVNVDLCRKFHIPYYPILLWGPPSKFIVGRWNDKQEKGEIRPVEDARTAEILLKWINTQLGTSYELEDEKFENDKLLHSNVSDPGQIAGAIYDVEEALTVAFDIILENKMIKSDTRATLIKFLQVMVAHHPSRRCRKGSADILVNFDDLYPSNMSSVNKEEPNNSTGLGDLRAFQICGKQVPRGYWMFCRGSKNETRGFSCGLWILLHSLSVRVDDEESQLAFTATCDFIHKFFICEECSQHFYDMCSSVSSPFNRTQDFVLWLWTAHNKVNERLMKTEAALGTGDPKFPKIIWPPNRLCPACYAARNQTNGSSWDHDEVFKFLVSHYGRMLVSRYKDKETMMTSHMDVKGNAVSEEFVGSTNALVVPMGAAVAIALASCLFGAVAYVWRSRQKNRKQRRSLGLTSD